MARKKRSAAQRESEKRYDEKRAGQRTRNWTVIFYPEDLPEDWKKQLDDLHFRWIESPLHDKDFNADGSPKKPHHHTLFMFSDVKRCEQITEMLKEVFGESETGSIVGVATPQQATDRSAIVRYMAHMDNPEKAQYDISEIVGHNGADVLEILRYSSTEKREMVVAMEEYIEQNSIFELADFSAAIRNEYPEWHTILTTQMTFYFNAFIRSRRHKMEKNELVQVNPDTGEVVK
jgi:hypothetical protein